MGSKTAFSFHNYWLITISKLLTFKKGKRKNDDDLWVIYHFIKSEIHLIKVAYFN